jgi:hypothetical protein
MTAPQVPDFWLLASLFSLPSSVWERSVLLSSPKNLPTCKSKSYTLRGKMGLHDQPFAMTIDLFPDDLLFEVEERPVFAGLGQNGYIRVPGKKAIVRRSDGHVLGVVGRDYRLVTNKEAMDAAILCCRGVFPQTKPEEWKFTGAWLPAFTSACRAPGFKLPDYLKTLETQTSQIDANSKTN